MRRSRDGRARRGQRSAWRAASQLALLVTVEPVAADGAAEDSDPLPAPGDRLVTAAALATRCGTQRRARGPRRSSCAPGGTGRTAARYEGPAPAPYLSRQAAAWLVERGIETLVLDLPSADRADDGGKLTAHRVFFGLPPGSRDARAARRPRASITELAWIRRRNCGRLLPARPADPAPS